MHTFSLSCLLHKRKAMESQWIAQNSKGYAPRRHTSTYPLRNCLSQRGWLRGKKEARWTAWCSLMYIVFQHLFGGFLCPNSRTLYKKFKCELYESSNWMEVRAEYPQISAQAVYFRGEIHRLLKWKLAKPVCSVEIPFWTYSFHWFWFFLCVISE